MEGRVTTTTVLSLADGGSTHLILCVNLMYSNVLYFTESYSFIYEEVQDNGYQTVNLKLII